jgi:hypothetical protein
MLKEQMLTLQQCILYTEESTNLLHLIVALYIIHYRTERYMDDNMTCLPRICLEKYLEIYTLYIKKKKIDTSRFENDYITFIKLG